MKALHVINDLRTGGAEKLVTETVPLFNAKGITTDVLLLNGVRTPFYKGLEEKGCKIYSLTGSSIYNPLLAFKIMPYLKKYDVVHVHLFPAQYWVALAKMLSFAFLGIRMDVPQLLKTANIVILSSQYEGLSLSIIEGMAGGRPFIASDVPGLINIVGGAGLLFPYKDHDALAVNIQELINNPDHYATVAKKCTVRATEYDIPIMIDKHIALYKNLMH